MPFQSQISVSSQFSRKGKITKVSGERKKNVTSNNASIQLKAIWERTHVWGVLVDFSLRHDVLDVVNDPNFLEIIDALRGAHCAWTCLSVEKNIDFQLRARNIVNNYLKIKTSNHPGRLSGWWQNKNVNMDFRMDFFFYCLKMIF